MLFSKEFVGYLAREVTKKLWHYKGFSQTPYSTEWDTKLPDLRFRSAECGIYLLGSVISGSNEGGGFMTGFRLASVCALAFLCAVPIMGFAAAAPDPHVIINDPPPGPCTPVGFHFDFNADGSGGGTQCFINNSGVDWFNLEVMVENAFVGVLTCGGNAFTFCDVEVENGFPTVDFFGGTLPNGMTFSIDLLGFAANGLFHADANEMEPEPEPATLVLLSSGLATFLFIRKKAA
jgi:hypothetical protein